MSDLGPAIRAAIEGAPPSAGVRLGWEVARLGLRLAELTTQFDGRADLRAELETGGGFLQASWAQFEDLDLGAHYVDPLLRRLPGIEDPIDRVVAGYGLSPCELDMVLLAGMAEEHEGYAGVLQSLHPRGEPWATVGLAAQLLTPEAEARLMLRRLIVEGPAVRSGLLQVGEGPFFNRSIKLAPGAWSALHGASETVAGYRPNRAPLDPVALTDWLAGEGPQRALSALAEQAPVTIAMVGNEPRTAFARGLALVAAAEQLAMGLLLPPKVSRELEVHVGVRALAFGQTPVVELEPPVTEQQIAQWTMPSFAGHPGPVVVCTTRDRLQIRGDRPTITVDCDRLPVAAIRAAWARALPSLADFAPALAARFPLEPTIIREVADDARLVGDLGRREPTPSDVLASVRARVGVALRPGVKVRQPRATWDALVLPPERLGQLHEAVGRVHHQARVIDEWGFLPDRPGARGVRMLFYGPPGTGKTLSAEVLASALGTDLMVVDLSRLVSKWIGETEKNLAEVFLAAERSRSVLLIDEADALFGKRTEVSDAHDRYANLETAYLLTRIEAYDGLCVLSSNLRNNIDNAFMRRLEFVVEYSRPSRRERLRLWEAHIPATAPLAEDVNLNELASFYTIVGGLIKNAAVAAAFLAAEEDSPISRDHLLRAIRREYEKTGAAFPGVPPGRRA